jgi:hypothetical protein
MAEKNGCTGDSSRVAVMRCGGEYTLVSRDLVPSGTWLFTIDGVLTDTPTRYSVQVGRSVHLDLPESYGHEEIMDRFFWRFMNHSCEPNAVIRGREVFALRAIDPREEITFDYNTTEYALAEPFDCRCGSDRCAGLVQGFGSMPRAEQERLRPLLAEHLLALLEGEALASSTTAEGHHVVDG